MLNLKSVMFKLSDVKNKATSFLGDYEQKDPATLAAAEQAVGGLLILDGVIGIDNPFGGKKRSGIFGSFIGVLIGIAIIFFGGLFFNLFGTQKLTADTTGQITAIGAPQSHTETDSDGTKSTSTTCTMAVSYTVDNKSYTQSTATGSSSNCNAVVGSNIAIKYDPASPNNFDTASTVNTFNAIKKTAPFVGLLVLIASLVTFVIRLLSIIFGWKLLRHGRGLAKTLPGGSGLKSQISQIRQEFKKTFFNGSVVASAIESVVTGNKTPLPPTPTAPVPPVQTPPVQTPPTQMQPPAQPPTTAS